MRALQRLAETDAVRRLEQRDPTLFTADVDQRQAVIRRLGWTDLAEKAISRLPLLDQLKTSLLAEGVTDIVLLGMGGSSLAPLVLWRTLQPVSEAPRLHVLDTTFPGTTMDLLGTLSPESTFFLLASKSGTTVEPLALYAIFREWADQALGRVRAGKQFIAVTDPDSPLDTMRGRELMRTSLHAPATVGGRYSALSMFGLAPSALVGLDMPTLISRARAMEAACWQEPDKSPGAHLAAWIADAYEGGRDKLTLILSPELAPFGLWAEQLVAESTGKQGKGIVPVIEHDAARVGGYGSDRAIVMLRLRDDEALAEQASAAVAEAPVYDIALHDAYDLGAEFVRWEVAVALTAALIGVNPFDEPNVTEAKEATRELLAGGLPVPQASVDINGYWVTYAGRTSRADGDMPTSLEGALRPLLSTAVAGDYLAVLAFLPEDEALLEPLRAAVADFSRRTRLAAMVELGPRYLHSTGQLHKGGPDRGLYMIVTARDRRDVPVPGQSYTLAALFRAQAEGDLATLAGHNGRVLRVDLPDLAPVTASLLTVTGA